MNNTQHQYKIIDAISDIKVLIIGDVILDIYEHCEVKRVSPEAPVLVASVKKESVFLGGAGNVANNVRALGADVTLVCVIGDDREGKIVTNLLEEKKINSSAVFVEISRQTTLKKRIVSGAQQLIRIDREADHCISELSQKSIKNALPKLIQETDVVIIADYCKGVLTDDIIAEIKQLSRVYNKRIFVDSKNKHLLHYTGVYLIKPNKEEAESFANERFTDTYSNLEHIGKKLMGIFESNLVITLGSDGVALFEDESFIHKTTQAREVFDVSGAGDTVMATLATAVAAGATLEEAVHLSNYAAGYVVSRLGTTTCSAEKLKDIIDGV